MTVKELIEKLKTYDPQHGVLVEDSYKSELWTISEVFFNKNQEDPLVILAKGEPA